MDEYVIFNSFGCRFQMLRNTQLRWEYQLEKYSGTSICGTVFGTYIIRIFLFVEAYSRFKNSVNFREKKL
jgi:hypothetical protein